MSCQWSLRKGVTATVLIKFPGDATLPIDGSELHELCVGRCCMARPLRVEYPGSHYHVMNRGNQRMTVFRRGSIWGQSDLSH